MTNSGRTAFRTNIYTQLETGMHYWDGEWKETVAAIEPSAGGAMARQGPHKVTFANNLNASTGGIDLETPEGGHLRTGSMGLSYFDPTTGKNVLIAEIKDCQGQIIASNQVLYADAFSDSEGVKADVRYTYTKAGFEQDIILRSQLPPAAKYGMDPQATRVQVLTEFLDAPPPVRSEQSVVTSAGGQVMEDRSMAFAGVRIAGGRAFALGTNDLSPGSLPVAREWLTVEGRNFLVEQAVLQDVSAQVARLPRSASFKKRGGSRHLATIRRQAPIAAGGAAIGGKMLVAQNLSAQSGYVLDYYMELTSHSGVTLRGDMTYYVTGLVSLSGTTTIEGGPRTGSHLT